MSGKGASPTTSPGRIPRAGRAPTPVNRRTRLLREAVLLNSLPASVHLPAAYCPGGGEVRRALIQLHAEAVCRPVRGRYRLLETVRQYAAARLAKGGDPEDARRRHAHAYLHLVGSDRDPLVLAPELDNFRAALDWSLSRGEDTGPRLAGTLGDFWLARGLLQEGRGWLERACGPAPPAGRHRL